MQHWYNKRRWIALLLVLCLIAFFCLSGAYFLANVHHVCTGEHCPICEHIGILLALTAEFGTIAVILFRLWAYCVPLTAYKLTAIFHGVVSTPIGRFDKMNN